MPQHLNVAGGDRETVLSFILLEMQPVGFLLHLFSHYFILIQATLNGTFGHTKFAMLDWGLYLRFVDSSPKREYSLLFEVGVKCEMSFVIQHADRHAITIRKCSIQCADKAVIVYIYTKQKSPNMTSQI